MGHRKVQEEVTGMEKSTYRYRNAAKRRAYMRSLMAKRRKAAKDDHNPCDSPCLVSILPIPLMNPPDDVAISNLIMLGRPVAGDDADPIDQDQHGHFPPII